MKLYYRLGTAAIILIAIVLFFTLSAMKEEPPKRGERVTVKTYESVIANKRDNISEIKVYGKMVTSQPVLLTSEVEGKLIKGDVQFLPAERFRKGDLLIKIDDRQMILDIKSLKSDFLNALTNVMPFIKVDFPDEYNTWENYFKNVKFGETLPEIPETDVEKIKLYLTRYNVYKLFFNIKNLEIKHSKHYFYAPFSGSVINTNYRPGSSVRMGAQLGEIINLNSMEIEAPVKVSDLPWISKNAGVEITSNTLPGTWTGRIKRIGNNIDARSQTINVYVDIKNLSEYKYNGLFFNLKLKGEEITSSVSVPRSAIYNDHSIYLIKNGRIQLTDIDISRRETDNVFVTSGIAAGDTVVVETLQGVVSGTPAKAEVITKGGSN